MLKFLVNESIGLKVAEKLKKMGFETVSVIEVMRGAEDEAVIRKVIEENRVILLTIKTSDGLPPSTSLPA